MTGSDRKAKERALEVLNPVAKPTLRAADPLAVGLDVGQSAAFSATSFAVASCAVQPAQPTPVVGTVASAGASGPLVHLHSLFSSRR